MKRSILLLIVLSVLVFCDTKNTEQQGVDETPDLSFEEVTYHFADPLPESPRPLDDVYRQATKLRKYKYWLEDEDVTQDREVPEDVEKAISLFETAAAAGNDAAMLSLGEIYQYGEGGEQDFAKAADFFQQAATYGNPYAQAELAFIYGTGKIAIDEPKSLLYYVFAARGGEPSSQLSLAYKYLHGHGVPKSCDTAAQWYEMAASVAVIEAELGIVRNPADQTRLSTEHDSTLNAAVDGDDLVDYYQYSADAGDMNAIVTMGNLYLQGGYGLEQDFNRALNYFQQAAQAGEPAGMSGLGYMHEKGLGVPQSNITAVHHYRTAADKGHAGAQAALGKMLLYGQGVPQSKSEAMKYFQLSAEKGFAEGQYYLAKIHAEAKQPDYIKAYQLFTFAGAQGHLGSLYALGRMSYFGQGTQKNCHYAVGLFKKVAERGEWTDLITDAHDMYELGDYPSALLQYEKAAEMGYELAQSNAAWLYDQGVGLNASKSWATKEYFDQQAFKYYGRAAEQQNAEAYIKLGDYYYYGKGTAMDLDRAAQSYSTATTRYFHPEATFNLGYMHQHGIGLPQDLFLAKRYYDMTLQSNPNAYIGVWLALIGLAFHLVYDILTGGKIAGGLEALVGLPSVQWDSIAIAVLVVILVIALRHRWRQ